jgi:RNA polymerase sigma-70 factor, ECF subfamily
MSVTDPYRDRELQHADARNAEARLRAGDKGALGELFAEYRPRLLQIVQFRMNRRVLARLDAEDVLQEAYIAAVQRLKHFGADPAQSVFVWLRLIVSQTIVDVHRRHVGAEMRDVTRELSLNQAERHDTTSYCLASELAGSLSTPSRLVVQDELVKKLADAMGTMPAADQEIIALRHFEDLSNAEAAEVLGLQITAASNRYVRAVARLKRILDGMPEFDNHS